MPRIRAEHAGRDAALAWLAVAIAVGVLMRIQVAVPLLGPIGPSLVPVVFVVAPLVVGNLRDEYLEDYGFTLDPLARSLATAGVVMLVVFPLFAAGYFVFYEHVCTWSPLQALMVPGQCAAYVGWSRVHAPPLDGELAEFVIVQLIVVAMTEELMFRGFLLGLLEQRFPPRHRILGGGIGVALVISSALFALIHLPRDGNAGALMTFFPALLFGWMRSRTGSILASTLFHAGCNLLIYVLDHMARHAS